MFYGTTYKYDDIIVMYSIDIYTQMYVCACVYVHAHTYTYNLFLLSTMRKYLFIIKTYYLVLLGSVIFILTGVQLWPEFHDIFLSVNKSRAYRLQIETEYFIDQERYSYLLLLHINASFYIGLLTLVATGTILNAYLQCACGMFKIAR